MSQWSFNSEFNSQWEFRGFGVDRCRCPKVYHITSLTCLTFSREPLNLIHVSTVFVAYVCVYKLLKKKNFSSSLIVEKFEKKWQFVRFHRFLIWWKGSLSIKIKLIVTLTIFEPMLPFKLYRIKLQLKTCDCVYIP